MRLRAINERVTISEAGLSRLLAQAKQRVFAIITAYRGAFGRQTNIERNRQLRGVLNAYRMGVHQLVGRWRECLDPDVPYADCPPEQLHEVVERSYFVTKPDNLSLRIFRDLLGRLMAAFDQDAYILGANGVAELVFRNGETQPIGQLQLGKLAQAYSQHVRKQQVPFVFEGIEIPINNIGRMVWKTIGLVVPHSSMPYRDILLETLN